MGCRPTIWSASHGELWVKSLFIRACVKLRGQFRYPRSEVRARLHDAARFRARSTSHTVAARGGCTNIPLAAGRVRDETILSIGILGDGYHRFVHPDPPELIRSWKIRNLVSACRQASFITAPSMTTPAVTYFHSATSSLRASATMVVFFRRPPLRLTRSLNHRASADCG